MKKNVYFKIGIEHDGDHETFYECILLAKLVYFKVFIFSKKNTEWNNV